MHQRAMSRFCRIVFANADVNNTTVHYYVRLSSMAGDHPVEVMQTDADELNVMAGGWDGTAAKRVKVDVNGVLASRPLESQTDSVSVAARPMQVLYLKQVGNTAAFTTSGAFEVYGVLYSGQAGMSSISSLHLYDQNNAATIATAPVSLAVTDGQIITFPGPVLFSTGLSIRAVEGVDPLGTTAPAGMHAVTLFYRAV
jgi:hypothetical protein